MKKEYWKPVVGYEGLYEVSNWGRVKSIKFGKEIILKQKIKGGYYYVNLSKNGILKPMKDNNGYLKVRLCNGEKSKTFNLHRLIAETFIPNLNNYKEVNHKNEIKTDNRVENLEWCDRKYNQNYGTRTEKCSKKLSKPVLQYTLEGEFVKEWKSIAECGRNGFNRGNVWMCCRGELKTHQNFIWKYK